MKCPHSWAAVRQKKNQYYEYYGTVRGHVASASFLRREAGGGREGFHHVPVMMDGFAGKSIHMEMLHHKYLHWAAVSMYPLLVLTHWKNSNGKKIEKTKMEEKKI